MIVDDIKNLRLYKDIHEKFPLAIDFIEKNNPNSLVEGRYEIDGDNLFVNIFRYQTKPMEESKLEGHKKYIDIQVMVKGNERVGFTLHKEQDVIKEYDETTDLVFYKDEVSWFDFNEGMFGIFYPTDLHQPAVRIENEEEVLKIVCKVKVEY